MGELYEVVHAYENVCKEKDVEPHPLIMAVLTVEKELDNLGTDESLSLYLAGNNPLITPQPPRLDDKHAAVLCAWLEKCQLITSIDLRYSNLTDEGIKFIADLLVESPFLESINVMCNDFGETGAQHLAEALQKNSSLRCLRLNGNKIGNNGGLHFAQALQINTTLESLDLGDTDLGTGSLIALSTVLLYNSSLKALNINRPLLFSLMEETTGHFARMLKVNTSLQELHMMKHDTKDFGATCLVENLMSNHTLTYLNLSCNRITRDGAKHIAEFLKYSTSLKVLDLGTNRIADDGAEHIAEALGKCNGTLETDLCMGNKMDQACCMAFKNLVDIGRLDLKKIDIKPYAVDGIVQMMANVSNGMRYCYYWGPAFGDNAQPELRRFSRAIPQVSH